MLNVLTPRAMMWRNAALSALFPGGFWFMRRIDAHCHFNGNHPSSAKMCDELNVKVMNICIGLDNHGAWRNQVERYRGMAKNFPEQFAWCTAFDLPRFD